jgi:hypothetical protein
MWQTVKFKNFCLNFSKFCLQITNALDAMRLLIVLFSTGVNKLFSLLNYESNLGSK